MIMSSPCTALSVLFKALTLLVKIITIHNYNYVHMCRCPNNTLNSPLTQPIRIDGCFIALRWPHRQEVVNWNFFCTAQPHSNALPQYFRLISPMHTKLQTRDFWHVLQVAEAISYCSQGVVGRKPGENRWFSGQVTSSPVTLVLDRVLGPLWTK